MPQVKNSGGGMLVFTGHHSQSIEGYERVEVYQGVRYVCSTLVNTGIKQTGKFRLHPLSMKLAARFKVAV